MCPDCGNGACSACANAAQTNAPPVCGARGEQGSFCDLRPHSAGLPHQDTRTGHAWTTNAARPPAPHISEAPTSREATSLPRPSRISEDDFADLVQAASRLRTGQDRPPRTLERELAEVFNRHGIDSSIGIADTQLAQEILKYLERRRSQPAPRWWEQTSVDDLLLGGTAVVRNHIEPEKAGPHAGDTIFLRGDRSERGAPVAATVLGKRHGEEWERRTTSWTTLARDHLGEEAAQLFGAALRSMKTMAIGRHAGELVAAAFEDARGPAPVLGAAYEDDRGRLYTLARDPGGKARIVVATYADGTRVYEHELVWRDRRHRLVRMPSGGAA